ncbi:putative mitochondrial inner membrane protein OXA1-like [Iris pallida]|uniref:Mitochondrial inner membrane protein OXA1-like n=1 Tax=Iris pallida TaxID=29817 RepID=A0AAX6FW32_IRIPA|nr:putative mitochondrial inner membrane protein OXA1-like [Iris pallida]
MACHRRALTTGFIHVSRRLHPSFSHIPLSHADRSDPPPRLPKSSSPGHGHGVKAPSFMSTSLGFSLPLGADSLLRRNYSSSGAAADGSTEIGYIKDVAEVLTETTVDATAATTTAVADAAAGVPPFSAEVVAAAADSYFPVAALQYLIDGVHTNVGVDWWAAIVLTTVLIRCSTVPLILNQMRATVKLNAMRPEMEQLKEQMQNSTDPESLLEGRKQMSALFRKHGVNPLTPLKGMFIQGPIFISFFMAISNMVEKVPSFKDGGAYWFTDLTTPDPLYALPVLTGLSFLATVELNMQDGMEGNPMVKTMKNFSRVLAVVTVPFTASFPKAIFCYWITSNMFSLAYGFIIRRPPVRKFLNLPEIVPQPTPASQPNFSFFGGSKLLSSLASPIAAKLSEPSKSPDQKVSSSAVISQRIRNLEKTVKARSKPKRR